MRVDEEERQEHALCIARILVTSLDSLLRSHQVLPRFKVGWHERKESYRARLEAARAELAMLEAL